MLAMIAGLLLAAAFPKIGITGLAWIAPALMLASALGRHNGESFRIGYVSGLTFNLASLYWLLLIPYRWHGIPLGPATGWLALSAFMALFPATWVWLISSTRGFKPSLQGTGSSVQNPARLIFEAEPFRGVLARSWAKRTLWAIYGAAVWVALEMVSARIFGGFPWNLLGSSQYQMVPLIQIASVTGIYGVSFLVVWLSLSFLSAGLTLLRRPIVRSAWLGDIILPMLVVALLFNLGFKRLAGDTPQPRLLSVTLIQPSIPQTLIWNAANDDERFRDLVRLSEQALSNRTDLLIWPEAAVPKLLRYDTNTFAAITDLARRHHIWMIVGSDDLEPRRNSSNPEGVDYFNSSFLIDPEGRLAARYLKRNLVIFGEYIPLADTVPFLKWFTPIQGGFASGDRPVPFELKDLGVKTSVMICYEDVFPHLARGNVEPDTDFLVNITNDGWFGEGAAQWQQTVGAVFRTVENNVPLIRCANNGLTCWVDACGRLRQILRDSRGSIYGPGYMTAEIPLPASGQHHARTYYNLHGDLFGWTCVGIAGALALGRFVRRRKRVGILAADF